jgi:hypothetical protein
MVFVLNAVVFFIFSENFSHFPNIFGGPSKLNRSLHMSDENLVEYHKFMVIFFRFLSGFDKVLS